jgi:hypothetical protein
VLSSLGSTPDLDQDDEVVLLLTSHVLGGVTGVPVPATFYSPTYADPSTMVPPMQAMVVPGSVAMMNGQPVQMVPVGGHYPQGMVAAGPMARAHSAPVPSDYYPPGQWVGPPAIQRPCLICSTTLQGLRSGEGGCRLT